MSITAFPVLCRILTELKLLETTVGVVVLSAGVGNDVVGWILLALTVALVNSAAGGEGTGVTAVYILLCAVGWTLVSPLASPCDSCASSLTAVCFPCSVAPRLPCPDGHALACDPDRLDRGRQAVSLYDVRRRDLQVVFTTGRCSRLTIPCRRAARTVTLFLVFASAFVTDIIGVHPIFGGFLAAFAVPREVALDIVIKIEDLVTVLFLPIYFTRPSRLALALNPLRPSLS
jgi:hypothetical protein